MSTHILSCSWQCVTILNFIHEKSSLNYSSNNDDSIKWEKKKERKEEGSWDLLHVFFHFYFFLWENKNSLECKRVPLILMCTSYKVCVIKTLSHALTKGNFSEIAWEIHW